MALISLQNEKDMKRIVKPNLYLYETGKDRGRVCPIKKQWFVDGIWPALPLVTKAIIPVALSLRHDAKWAFQSDIYIASMAGIRNTSTVSKAFAGLVGMEDFEMVLEKNRYGHQSRKFRFQVRMARKQTFPFSCDIISAGLWYFANRPGKASYPALRFMARPFDREDYIAEYEHCDLVEGLIIDDEDDFDALLATRRFDIVDTTIAKIGEYAGLSRKSVRAGLQSLIDVDLVRKGKYGGYLVMVKPTTHFTPKIINKQVSKDLHSQFKKYNLPE